MALYDDDEYDDYDGPPPPKKKPPKGELSEQAAKKIAEVISIMLNDKK